jgi:tetratricopeptide (TPR) repeat protein
MRPRQVALAAFALAVIVAPQLLGGAQPWALVTTAALSLLALALTQAAASPTALPARALRLAALATMALTAMQACPMPCGWVEVLRPAAAADQRTVSALLGAGQPTTCTLSMAPGATRIALLSGLALLAIFFSALRLSADGLRDEVMAVVGASCAALALTSFVHGALGLERVFGLYAPQDVAGAPLIAPVLALNSLGGALTLGVLITIGLGLAASATPVRLVWVAAAMLSALVVLMTRSRGAVGALILGLLLLGAMRLSHLRRRRRRRHVQTPLEDRAMAVALTVTVIGGGLAAVLSFQDVLAREIAGGGLDKLELIARAAQVALDYPVIGIGRGAFASVFPSTGLPTGLSRFEFVESFPVQWAVEWGLPAALALAIALAATVLASLRRARSPERQGALLGLFVYGLQNLVDLGLELPGVAVLPAGLLGAAVVSEGNRRGALHAPAAVVRPTLRWLPVAAGMLALLLLAPRALERERGVLEARLRAAIDARDAQVFARELEVALHAHPREPAFPILAAVEALGRRDPAAAGPFINRAMQVAPNWAAPHVLAVHWLVTLGRPGQALIELREALKRDPGAAGQLMCRLLRAAPERWSEAIPDGGSERMVALNRAAECFPVTSPAARAVDTQLLKERPRHGEASRREAQRQLAADDPEAALETLRPLLAAPRIEGRTVALAARALLAQGRPDELQLLLDRTRGHVDHPAALLEVEARAAAAAGDAEGMRRAMSRLRAEALEEQRSVTPAYLTQADLEMRIGKTEQALDLLEHGYRITKDSRLLLREAELAERAGQTDRARAAYRRLCVLDPSDGAACGAAARRR